MDALPSQYHEEAVPWLGRVIRCRWTQRISATGSLVQRVVPDACADVIVDDDGAAVLVGPATTVDLPLLRAGATLWGLRIRPEAIGAVLGVPADELTDRSLPLDAILPCSVARGLTELATDPSLVTEPTPGPIAARLVDTPIDERVRRAVDGLLASAGTLGPICDDAFLSGRHLRRRMLEEVGLGPKLVQRIGRLQRFLALAESQGHPYRLAWLAQAAGYADQAHLNREVRALAGVTPRELLSERARATLATAGSGSDAAARVG